jgi:hypothetical protein
LGTAHASIINHQSSIINHPKLKLLAFGILSSLSLQTSAGDAVSGVNGKVATFLGNVENAEFKSNDTRLLQGSLTAPLSSRFGIQGDALTGELNDKNVSGLGVHVFWRDSDVGLLGLTHSNTRYDGNKLNQTSLEGEYYFSTFTVAGKVGKQNGDVDDANFGSLNLSYYPNKNLALSLGTSRTDDQNQHQLDIEYQTRIKGLSVFANASQGDDDYEQLIGGLRYYFGKQKSLQARHRQDDPPNRLFKVANNLAFATEKAKRLASEEAARIAAEEEARRQAEEAARIAAEEEARRKAEEAAAAATSSSSGDTPPGRGE